MRLTLDDVKTMLARGELAESVNLPAWQHNELCKMAINQYPLVQELVAALEGMETKLINFYRAANPHANYDGGNRMADQDTDVILARKALSRARGG